MTPPSDVRERMSHTQVKPHQQVFQITQRLHAEGRIRGVQVGKAREFWVDEGVSSRQNIGVVARIVCGGVFGTTYENLYGDNEPYTIRHEEQLSLIHS